MKGTLHKTKKGEWLVIYDEILGEGIVKKNQNALPVLSIEYDLSTPVSPLTEGKTVEFEIDELIDITPDGTEIIKYAKLINY